MTCPSILKGEKHLEEFDIPHFHAFAHRTVRVSGTAGQEQAFFHFLFGDASGLGKEVSFIILHRQIDQSRTPLHRLDGLLSADPEPPVLKPLAVKHKENATFSLLPANADKAGGAMLTRLTCPIKKANGNFLPSLGQILYLRQDIGRNRAALKRDLPLLVEQGDGR